MKGAVLCSVSVGDAGQGSPIAELVADLSRRTHLGVEARVGHHVEGCSFDAFANEPGTDGGRAEFEASMRSFNLALDVVAGHLAEWDACERPVAIVHAIEAGRL